MNSARFIHLRVLAFAAFIGAFAACATVPEAKIEDLNAPVFGPAPAPTPVGSPAVKGDPKDPWSFFANFS